MDVSNFLKKLKKRLSEKKQNEETEVHGANLEEIGGGRVHEDRVSDNTQCDATSNKEKLHLYDQKSNYVTRELANVNGQHKNNNILREESSNINDNEEDDEEEEEEDNVFFTATSTDTTHQRHRRKSIVSNYYNNNSSNDMIDEQPPVTLSDIKHYHILKDLPALNVVRANAKEEGFRFQRSTLKTSLASTQSSLRQKRHMLLSAMQAKAKETSIDKNDKYAREELKTDHSISDRNYDSSKNDKILEEESVITDDNISEKMGKRVRLEEEEHALGKHTMATDVEKKNVNNKDNIKINNQAVKMLSVDELLSSASETALPINIDFGNLDSVTEILADTREIANNTQPRGSIQKEQSFLEEHETNVAEIHNGHFANAEDKHNNINSSKSDAELDAPTECATKTTIENAKDVNNSVVDSTTTATFFSSTDVVDDKTAAESAQISKQTNKLNAFARAKLLAQNSTLPGNDAMLNTKHDRQIYIQHF